MRRYGIVILGAAAAAVCIRLGFWQVSRLRQRIAWRAMVEQRQRMTPLDLARVTGAADSLGYLSMRGLINALKQSRDDVCLGCLTGEYPIVIPGEKVRKEKPLEMFAEASRRKETRKSAVKKH